MNKMAKNKINELYAYPSKNFCFEAFEVRKNDAIIPVGSPPTIGANSGPNTFAAIFDPEITLPPIKKDFKYSIIEYTKNSFLELH